MKLSEIRGITGLSATKFAKKYGIPQSTYAKWELPEDSPIYRDCPDYTKDLLERAVKWEYIDEKKHMEIESENMLLWKFLEEQGLSREAHRYVIDKR